MPLPGTWTRVKTSQCDDEGCYHEGCQERPSWSVCTESDSMGSEFEYYCEHHTVEQKKVYAEAPPLVDNCDRCGKKAELLPSRDWEEGSKGPVYDWCSSCRSENAKAAMADMDELDNDDDYVEDSDNVDDDDLDIGLIDEPVPEKMATAIKVMDDILLKVVDANDILSNDLFVSSDPMGFKLTAVKTGESGKIHVFELDNGALTGNCLVDLETKTLILDDDNLPGQWFTMYVIRKVLEFMKTNSIDIQHVRTGKVK